MPNCKFQRFTTAPPGFEIQTNEYGLLAVAVVTVGNTTTVSQFKDGILQSAPTVTNANAGVLESLISNFLNGIVVGVQPGGPKHINTYVHVDTVNPFSCQLLSSSIPVSGQWWTNA